MDYLPNEVKRMIAADNISGAIQYLGGTAENKRLLDIIVKKEEKEIKEIYASITFYETISNEEKKKYFEDKLEKVKTKLSNLKEKIQREDTGDCPLCYDEYKESVLTNCCNALMCVTCVGKLVTKNSKCPYCREKLDLSKMIVSTNETTPKKKIKTKLEVLIEILKSKPHGKFIVFSEFANTFEAIEDALLNNEIKYVEVKGTVVSRHKQIEKYKTGDVQVVFLNHKSDATGINLPETTDVILYHRLSSKAMETQILGRALRLGRTSELYVHRLLSEEEEFIKDNEREVVIQHEIIES
jgi:SNF2 family DNA or RNA helicase